MPPCTKHPYESGRASCRRCGLAWCEDCLVYAYGPGKPPFCIGCAMFTAGVRTAAAAPARPSSWKERWARRRVERAAARPTAHRPVGGDGDRHDAPPEPAVDWSRPWWNGEGSTLMD